jgi:3-deoxy-D-manno-octulosonic-acid transferase
MLQLYNAALLPLRLAAEAWGAIPRRDPARRDEWNERLARRLPSPGAGGALWIHGSSVGEAQLVSTLARALRERQPELALAASAFTRTGRSQLPAPPAVDASFFAPLDFPGLPRRRLRALRPAALALVETELWPNLLREAHQEGVPVAVVNGRLSPRRMRRYDRLASLYRPLVRELACVGAQSEEDAERFRRLGARAGAVRVTGNLKYDVAPPRVDLAALRRRAGLAEGRPVLVAGSTGRGEEPLVLDAFSEARREHRTLLLVLAPRHPDRVAAVEQLVRDRGLGVRRLSRADAPASPFDVLLVDTLGELASLYALGAIAFVGGSLVPIGGHNVLEPAAAAVPVLFGPHTEHVGEPAAALELAGGGLRVRDATELGREVSGLLADPEARERMGTRAAALVASGRGALAHTVALLLALVDRSATGPHVGAA